MPKKNVILLTGKPGIGKTTLIKKIVTKFPNCGGFYTREVRIDGIRTGFEIVTLDGEIGTIASASAEVEFDNQAILGKYRINIDVIENLAIPSVHKAVEEKNIIIVDEIGPMELFSDRFKVTILDILNNHELPVIGTIVQRSHEFADRVKNHPRVKVLRLDGKNGEDIYVEVKKLLEEAP